MKTGCWRPLKICISCNMPFSTNYQTPPICWYFAAIFCIVWRTHLAIEAVVDFPPRILTNLNRSSEINTQIMESVYVDCISFCMYMHH
jgi:hypothetical protein